MQYSTALITRSAGACLTTTNRLLLTPAHCFVVAAVAPPPTNLLVQQVHDGTNTPLNQFLKDPESLITRVTWKDEQDKVRLRGEQQLRQQPGAQDLESAASVSSTSTPPHPIPPHPTHPSPLHTHMATALL